MRLVVPLQGVVQGRGGLVLGSLLPCALFYFLQLYLKRNRPSLPPPPPPPPPPPSEPDPASSSGGGGISRTLSRGVLSPRGSSVGPVKLSSRGAAVAAPDDSTYYIGLKSCVDDPYHPLTSPDGIIQLGLAENQLSLDLIRNCIARKMKEGLPLGETEVDGELFIGELVKYQPYGGLMGLKRAIATFMRQVMPGSISFDPSQIVLTAGATPAMEILSFCLADPGDAFLVPSPYYPGWDRDIKWRTGIELIPVQCRSTDNFNISIVSLERTYNQAKKRGLKVRAVLFSNPSNPVGNVLNQETLRDILDFVTEKNMHLISDEIFAGSTFGDTEFVSVAKVLDDERYDRSRVHIIYGLSKDLSLAGFRVGVIYSYNESVLASASKLARFSSISTPTQHLLMSMLLDTKLVSEYLEMNRHRLQKMYTLFVNGLKQLGIKCASSSGGFYCWADMSKFIRPYSEKGELNLWEELLNVAKINITPGSACHCIEPGWFRCCFTTLTERDIPVVLERIKLVTETFRIQS